MLIEEDLIDLNIGLLSILVTINKEDTKINIKVNIIILNWEPKKF